MTIHKFFFIYIIQSFRSLVKHICIKIWKTLENARAKSDMENTGKGWGKIRYEKHWKMLGQNMENTGKCWAKSGINIPETQYNIKFSTLSQTCMYSNMENSGKCWGKIRYKHT